jgi:glycosyltransferase involved in cell wall biosynthesis
MNDRLENEAEDLFRPRPVEQPATAPVRLTTRAHCIVITRFAREQPGFLDFSYRLGALARHYRLTVVSDAPLTQPELQVDAEYVVLPGGDGRVDWLRYLWHCGCLIRMRRPACAVLLHSAAAPVALLAADVRTALYWNEHPTHFAGPVRSLSPLRCAARWGTRWLAFQGARKATVVMPIGEAHYEDLLQHGCAPQRVKLIHMGVDRSFSRIHLQPVSGNDDAPLELIYVGTVSKARGRDVMLEALKCANRNGTIARLTMVGASADEVDYCCGYARDLGIADAVRIHGRVDGAAIPAFLKTADVGLCLWEDQPWWRFNPPTKLFEYLAAGLPVLASDICTHTQYVSDWHNGLIFKYDSQSLARAIRKLWHRRTELLGLKWHARESGKQYLWDKLEPVFLQAVREIARP